MIAWIEGPPGPVAVLYEAGPTGLCSPQSLRARGAECQVARSKLQRPGGDRVNTDARDALQLARLVKFGEIVEVGSRCGIASLSQPPRSSSSRRVTWSRSAKTRTVT
jgi:hypothetical protein